MSGDHSARKDQAQKRTVATASVDLTNRRNPKSLAENLPGNQEGDEGIASAIDSASYEA